MLDPRDKTFLLAVKLRWTDEEVRRLPIARRDWFVERTKQMIEEESEHVRASKMPRPRGA